MEQAVRTEKHVCKMCGRCCLTVGRTFWKHGNLRHPKPFGNLEELNRKAMDGDHEDNGLPCEMLKINNGKSICRIHRDFGYEAKPIACRDYPENGELCFREEELEINKS